MAEELLYGGAAGGGKSLAILAEAWTQAIESPGNHLIMLRRTFPELERSLILESNKLFPQQVAEYNQAKHRWTIQTAGAPSIIDFGYSKTELDIYQYKSAQYGGIFIDQAEEFTEFQYQYLMSRLRSSDKSIWPRIRLSANPGGVGHGWLKRRFRITDISNHGRVWRPTPSGDQPKPPTRCFIPARVWDNPALIQADPAYIDRLRSLPPNERAMLLEGSWDVFAGQAFAEWSPALHTCEPFTIPAHWRAHICVDFGFSKPFAAHAPVLDPHGRVYIARELYGTQIQASDQAELMVRDFFGKESKMGKPRMPGLNIRSIIHDPSMVAQTGHIGKSVIEIYQDVFKKYGITVSFISGNNDRLNGKHQFHDFLKLAADQKPWIVYFRNCVNAIRTIPELVIDPLRPEDIDSDGEDHAYDADRYFLMSRPRPSMSEPPKDDLKDLDPASRAEWENVRKRQKDHAAKSRGLRSATEFNQIGEMGGD